MTQFQKRIRELRKRMDWSQEDLAREIGVSLSTIQRWETKGTNPIRLARVQLRKLFQQVEIEE